APAAVLGRDVHAEVAALAELVPELDRRFLLGDLLAHVARPVLRGDGPHRVPEHLLLLGRLEQHRDLVAHVVSLPGGAVWTWAARGPVRCRQWVGWPRTSRSSASW